MSVPTASPPAHRPALVAIKLLHTAVWAFLVVCIVALPLLAAAGRWLLAAWAAGIVLLESAILLANGWKCPLTSWAARYTTDRHPNFDIYLPLWLARHNKTIFSILFGINLIATGFLWFRVRF